MNQYVLFAIGAFIAAVLLFAVPVATRRFLRSSEGSDGWTRSVGSIHADLFGIVPMVGFITGGIGSAWGAWDLFRTLYVFVGLAELITFGWWAVRARLRQDLDLIAAPYIMGAFLAGFRFAAIAFAGVIVIFGSSCDSLALCLVLSFVVWALCLIMNARAINFAAVALFVWALLFALIEIAGEGGVGWALAAPTWRTQNALYGAFMNGKELTGYHLFMFVLPLVLFHLPFAFGRLWGGIKWTLAKELEVIALYFLLSVTWDFLWFVLNPSFTLERFMPGEIWWHAKWLWRVPTDYVSGIGLAAVLTAIVAWKWDRGVIKRMGTVFAAFALGTALVAFSAPTYHKWQNASVQSHGGPTDTWEKYLSPVGFDRLKRRIGDIQDARDDIARIGWERAQAEQLRIRRE